MLQVIKRKRIWPRVLLAVVAIVGGLWWWHHHQEAAAGDADGKRSSTPWSLWPGQMPNAAPTLGEAPTPSNLPPEAIRPVPSPLDTMQPPVCRADGQGHLAVDMQTKNDIERIYALYQGDEAQSKLTACAAGLPANAQRELKDLFQNYSQYAKAVAQAYPPADGETNIDDAKKQFKGIQNLRRQYFGEDTAKALFAQEEEITRDLLGRIEANKDPKMSFEEKINKAQEDQNKSGGAQQP
jgi:hypothetical protein